MNYNDNIEMDPNINPTYPLMALDATTTETADFDYAAFYHQQQPHHHHHSGEDIDYLAEESSASASTSGNLLPSASDATLQSLNPALPPSLLTVPALPSNTTALVLHGAHSPGSYGQPYPRNQLQLPSFAPASAVSGTGYNDGSSGGGSPAASSSHGGGGGGQGSTGSGSGSGMTAAGKQRLERRGHTKSRRGCFNCKRRRIKVPPFPPFPISTKKKTATNISPQCQETRPSCGHCLKTGLACEYPSLPTIIHQPSNTLPLFSLLDLRLYHHFLSTCYLHHPIGSEPLWLHTVPHLSQSHPYLMHAILGYSASHLLQSDPSISLTPAMSHRLKAIKSIKKALASIPSSSPHSPQLEEQGNALMATCFTLTYQSTLLDDGMAEYMTFVRGVVIVSIAMFARSQKLIFGDFLQPSHSQSVLEPHMRSLPLVKKEWVDGAVHAIKKLGEVVPGEGTTQRRYWELLLNMAEGLYKGGWEGYQAMTEHYGWWMMLPHEDFQVLVDVPGNQVSVLLGAHWVALKMVMVVVTEGEMMGSAEREKKVVVAEGGEIKKEERWKEGKDPRERSEREGVKEGIGRWLRWLNQVTEGEWRGYGGWCRWVEQKLDEDLTYFGKTV
ncbi:hypothetical protein QBC36DRAFT_47712 [Triangularia setosa]|uniref:Zn(2)-C6 fungal-type domain-containing protein n=1 Tax=Triangularia setosa TaxID=2587417 RepID=A0AAN6W2B2_9PEZI|nr:hypothetical protein QBC36DRAFT_47712 [Podospora setosa]